MGLTLVKPSAAQQQALQQQGIQSTNDALTRVVQQINAGLIGGGTPTPPPPDDTPAANVATPQLSPGSTATGSYYGVGSAANPTQYAPASLTLPPLAAPKKAATSRSRVAA